MNPTKPSKIEINKTIDLVSNGLFDDALTEVNNLIKVHSDNPLLFNIKGACYAGLRKHEDAVNQYSKAIEIEPNYAKAHFNLGGTFQDLGLLDESIQSYKKCIEIEPEYSEAFNNLGNVYRELGQYDLAIKSFKAALSLNPNYIEAEYSLGLVFQNLGLSEAIQYFENVLKTKPEFSEAHNNLGIMLRSIGELDKAYSCYEKAILINPKYSQAHNNLGNVLHDLGRYNEAIASYKTAISLNPDYPSLHINLGNTFKEIEQFEDALKSYENAISLNPDYSNSHNYLGTSLFELGFLDEAVKSYKKALSIDPENSDAFNNLGLAYKDLGRINESFESYKKALSIDPENSDVLNNLGVAYKDFGNFNDAIQSYEKAISINPNDIDALNNLGIIFSELGQLEDSINSYERAISINSNFSVAYNNLAIALMKLDRYEEAYQSNQKALLINPKTAEGYSIKGQIFTEMNQLDDALKSFEKAFEIDPNLEYNLGSILRTKMNLCNWNGLSKQLENLKERINNKDKVIVPFDLLCLIDDPELQGKTSIIYANDQFPRNNILPKIDFYSKHEKIRIGYFSADFRVHPVATLTAELYEIHDRSKFDIHAFSFGPDTNDEMNLRIKKGVDYFHNVQKMSHLEIVTLARSLEIDIAIDLGGYTENSRTGVFAMSAAPIQICYIGVLSTMGIEYYDYLVVGKDMIPEKNQKFYSEKIVYLPSYQVNVSKESLPEKHFTREDLGISKDSFVFCCFNNTYKITPTVFDSWARILANVEESVMMIYISNEIAKENLIKEIILRGIDPERLIFVEKLPRADYLARYRLADLFLDTNPYNAGTTASDALRMSLPVLTMEGDSFNSREAASIINSLNLSEMITASQEEYESLAIELAKNPNKYKIIKEKLSNNLNSAPLFDTSKFTKNFESALIEMHERHHSELKPEHIYI